MYKLLRAIGRALPEPVRRRLIPMVAAFRQAGGHWPVEPSASMTAGPVTAARAIEARWPAFQPLACFPVPDGPPRLSVVTDSVGMSSLFGGVGTALILGTLLANRLGASLRIITLTEFTDGSPLAHVLKPNGLSLDRGLETVFAHAAQGRTVPVHDRDIFMTTSWWSTYRVLPGVPRDRLLYLLQEDERMFYPHGDDRVRCAETLGESGFPTVVNTELLFRHLTSGPERLKHLDTDGLWFEPAFHQGRQTMAVPRAAGKRRFFFYARPNNLRNLFWRGIEVLSAAIEAGILDPARWEIHFVGSHIPDIILPYDTRPIRTSGLSWSAYQDLVRGMDAGMVLMDTPHPSYPPLDLAAAGVAVLTNAHGMKTDLSCYSANITTAPPTLSGLLEGLRHVLAAGADDSMRETNRNQDNIVRDWRAALDPAVEALALHFAARS